VTRQTQALIRLAVQDLDSADGQPGDPNIQ
jgi:hypothetical protein